MPSYFGDIYWISLFTILYSWQRSTANKHNTETQQSNCFKFHIILIINYFSDFLSIYISANVQTQPSIILKLVWELQTKSYSIIYSARKLYQQTLTGITALLLSTLSIIRQNTIPTKHNHTLELYVNLRM